MTEKLTKPIVDAIANRYVVDILNGLIYEAYGYIIGLSVDPDYFEDDFKEQLDSRGIEPTKANMARIYKSFTKQLTSARERVEKVFAKELGRYEE